MKIPGTPTRVPARLKEFISWACSDFRGFYDDLSWQGCEAAIAELPPDRCFFFHPPLWTAERGWPPKEIRTVPVHEAWGYQMEIARQLDEAEERGTHK
jgi:Protein of unknown function DUF2625